MKKLITAIALIALQMPFCFAQQTKRVLFIGNSYTYVNNLPGMVADMAASVGDELRHTSSTPGGCTFMQHCSNQSMTLIQQGGWDAVILQEQSQYPSFPQEQVEAEVFPYATQLVNAIYASSPCAEPMFYMTWGRRDGDQMNANVFPVLGTYEGMDSMLCLRYTQMAADNDASLCPVGRVWRMLRTEHPEINLYDSDGSHPSLAGTYAAACAFYALLFHHDPAELTFSANLNEDVARTIRSTASQIVWSIDESAPQTQWTRPLPHAEFHVSSPVFQPQEETPASLVSVFNTSIFADTLAWSFGDGTTLTTAGNIDSLSHLYTDTGAFTVTLVASRHCMTDTASLDIFIHYTIPTDTTIIDTTIIDTVGIHYPVPISEFQVSIHPTITTGIITIETSSPIEISVFSPIGKTIMHKQLYHNCKLDLSPFESGIYLIHIRHDGITKSFKVVKK